MDTVLDSAWTTETFLAWEDRQEGRHEFDGFQVIPMTGGSVAHQKIVFNLCVLLGRLLEAMPLQALHEMRLRIGQRIRYPDVLVCASDIPQTQKTLADAVVVFEVLSDDTAETDHVKKLVDYAEVPSLLYYVILEQSSRAAVAYQKQTPGMWLAEPVTEGAIVLPSLGLCLPLDDVYRGLRFPALPGDA